MKKLRRRAEREVGTDKKEERGPVDGPDKQGRKGQPATITAAVILPPPLYAGTFANGQRHTT